MQVSDFNYKLPDELIAKFPPTVRGRTRLLILDKASGELEHRHYFDLGDYLKAGDVVVLNDTKVIKARLVAKNRNGRNRELLLLEFHSSNPDHHQHQALYRGSLQAGENLSLGKTTIHIDKTLGDGVVEISSDQDLFALADRLGSVPLPPYMKRQATQNDVERYQTQFAAKAGSVAAPTASLNFTNELKNKLEDQGVVAINLTLHVGLGTFLPIRVKDLEEHKMHSEYFEIPATTVEAIRQAKQSGHKVLAVGTTVCRTLEFASDRILGETEPKDIRGEADIFIYTGYKFKVIDALLTNFHAPKSTVLMMAAAFAGWSNLKAAYEEAMISGYKFLSYGDSMLIL